MTLVIGAATRHWIWLLTDRRLSFDGRPPRDDARKILILETPDGVALLGYCGLGITAQGTEPSDWMAGVLRGLQQPLEALLEVLGRAIVEQIPKHLHALANEEWGSHNVIIPAFLDRKPRIYAIDLVINRRERNARHRVIRCGTRRHENFGVWGPGVAIGGSGAVYLAADRAWLRTLRKVLKAHDRGCLTPRGVANYLATINQRVHAARPESVGPDCVVAWRASVGGGGQQFFKGTSPAASDPLPTIAHGMPINAVLQAILPSAMPRLEARLRGEPIDSEALCNEINEINERLARLPGEPEEDLT